MTLTLTLTPHAAGSRPRQLAFSRAMPRPARLILPGVPVHITQRGVDRCATFRATDDFAYYRWALREASAASQCAVHAYALMTNHVHLLLTAADATGPACLMRRLGCRYVRYFNDQYRRTGTLWEGRYRCALVDSAPYFFACSRYIELNAVRAGIVDEPAAYAWSSFRANAWGEDDALVTPHALYARLGSERSSRCAAYRALFGAELEPSVVAALRAASRGRTRVRRPPDDAGDAAQGAGAAPSADGRASASGTGGVLALARADRAAPKDPAAPAAGSGSARRP